MKKYSEIKLTDDERKLLEVLKSQKYENIGKEIYPGEECHSDIYGRTGRVQDFLLLDWFDGFDWMDYNDEYEIEKLLNPPHEQKTVWDLKKNDKYWYIYTDGIVIPTLWCNSTCDKEYRNQGNVFLTEEEAKFESKRREVYAIVKKYTRPFRQGKPNWCAYWNPYDECTCFDCIKNYQDAQLYFESEEQIKRAIAEVGEEDFKKYYLGVTE